MIFINLIDMLDKLKCELRPLGSNPSIYRNHAKESCKRCHAKMRPYFPICIKWGKTVYGAFAILFVQTFSIRKSVEANTPHVKTGRILSLLFNK